MAEGGFCLYSPELERDLERHVEMEAELHRALERQEYRLKIDQSFVRDIMEHSSSAALVQSILSMAHNLGLATIAEGWKILTAKSGEEALVLMWAHGAGVVVSDLLRRYKTKVEYLHRNGRQINAGNGKEPWPDTSR